MKQGIMKFFKCIFFTKRETTLSTKSSPKHLMCKSVSAYELPKPILKVSSFDAKETRVPNLVCKSVSTYELPMLPFINGNFG